MPLLQLLLHLYHNLDIFRLLIVTLSRKIRKEYNKVLYNDLYIYRLDSSIVQSNLSHAREQELYNEIIDEITGLSADSDMNTEDILAKSGLSDAYKQKAMVYVNIIKRRERIRKLGTTVSNQIPDEMYKNGVPDEIAINTILSQQDGFKPFRLGDITTQEMKEYIYNPVEEKRREIQRRRLEQYREEIDKSIGLSTDIKEISKKLEKICSGDVWDGDAQLIRGQNLQKKKDIRVRKQKSYIREIAADTLIGFFEDTADYNFFYEESEYSCENAYSRITYDVVENMKFSSNAQENEFYQEIGRDGVKNIVKSLVAEMEKIPEDKRYDFLADTAGYGTAKDIPSNVTFSSLDALRIFFGK